MIFFQTLAWIFLRVNGVQEFFEIKFSLARIFFLYFARPPSHKFSYGPSFILDRIDQELPSLERSELKFGLSSEFFNKIPVRILLDVLFRVFRFLRRLFMPWHLCSWHFETSSPSWHWDVRKVAMAIWNYKLSLKFREGVIRHQWYYSVKLWNVNFLISNQTPKDHRGFLVNSWVPTEKANLHGWLTSLLQCYTILDFLNYFSFKLPTTFARISIASEKQ